MTIVKRVGYWIVANLIYTPLEALRFKAFGREWKWTRPGKGEFGYMPKDGKNGG